MHVRTLDLNYLGEAETIASYLVEAPDGPVLVECGPASTVDALTAALGGFGVSPSEVKHVVVSHIHLDHAGAAGWWAQEHGARVYVHEFGAQHLVDPSKLIASATRIYGDQMKRLWGTILAVPEHLVTPVHDDDVLEINGLELRALETPGHARHHHAFALDTGSERICFTGDAAAMFVPRTRFITIPMPPPEFDLEAWLTSIDRLREERFDAIYPTHFGRVDDADGYLAELAARLPEHAAFIGDRMKADRDDIVAQYTAWVRGQAVEAGLTAGEISHFVSSNLLQMSVDGVRRYRQKRAEASRAG